MLVEKEHETEAKPYDSFDLLRQTTSSLAHLLIPELPSQQSRVVHATKSGLREGGFKFSTFAPRHIKQTDFFLSEQHAKFVNSILSITQFSCPNGFSNLFFSFHCPMGTLRSANIKCKNILIRLQTYEAEARSE